MIGKDQYVIPRGKGWAIRGAGSSKDTKCFSTQEEAIKYGKQLAKYQQGKLIIQDERGKLQEVLTMRGL